MEEFILPEDIKVISLVAESFPDGVMKAHEKLNSLLSFNPHRRYFGISWGGENELIHYRAAADILSKDENELPDTLPFIIRKGKYQSILIPDFMKNISAIGENFTLLLDLPDLDPNGYCLEWYIGNKDVRCMVLMKA